MTATWTCWRNAAHPIATTRFGWPKCQECGAAPQYYERARYVPDDFEVGIYVPASSRAVAIIAPGSAIVGVDEEERTLVYFEGWVHGQYNDLAPEERYDHGLLHAADRMLTAYPTMGTAYLPAGDVVRVGTYWPRTRRKNIEDEAALAKWVSA